VEMIGLKKPVLPMMTAVEIDPVHRTFGEGNFVGDEAGEGDARNHGVLKALAKCRARAVKKTAGKSLLEWSGSNGNTVGFNGGAWGITGDLERRSESKARETERNCNERQNNGQREREKTMREGTHVASQ
jgi:hypothetical protein